ncbi:MAG: F0F1 ATP synthase subunit B [Tissierellaceae bacterium]|nr:F0F1 ATP synthase subunit B [Tissierellaceae bacterium]
MDIQVLALPQLIPTVITLVSVFILYLILRKFLYTPVTNFLEARKAKIHNDLEKAKSLKIEAEGLKSDYESKISEVKLEGQEILENSRQRGNEIRESILEEARHEAKTIVERARKDIAREKEKAFEDIKKSSGDIAILIATKIMEENINIDNQRNLFDRFIDEVGSSKWHN